MDKFESLKSEISGAHELVKGVLAMTQENILETAFYEGALSVLNSFEIVIEEIEAKDV